MGSGKPVISGKTVLPGLRLEVERVPPSQEEVEARFMKSFSTIVLEYLESLRRREFTLRRGKSALHICLEGVYPGHEHLAPLYSLLGALARIVEREGETLRYSDPGLWLVASRLGFEKAVEELRRASREVREADEARCVGVESSMLNHALWVTWVTWRETVAAIQVISRRWSFTLT